MFNWWPFTRRCPAYGAHRRRDTGEVISVRCDRERRHPVDDKNEFHYWGSDTRWL